MGEYIVFPTWAEQIDLSLAPGLAVGDRPFKFPTSRRQYVLWQARK